MEVDKQREVKWNVVAVVLDLTVVYGAFYYAGIYALSMDKSERILFKKFIEDHTNFVFALVAGCVFIAELIRNIGDLLDLVMLKRKKKKESEVID